MRAMIVSVLLAALSLSNTARIGRMAISAKVRKFNFEVAESKWGRELVFLILYFVNVVREEGRIVVRDSKGQELAMVDSMTGQVQSLVDAGKL